MDVQSFMFYLFMFVEEEKKQPSSPLWREQDIGGWWSRRKAGQRWVIQTDYSLITRYSSPSNPILLSTTHSSFPLTNLRSNHFIHPRVSHVGGDLGLLALLWFNGLGFDGTGTNRLGCSKGCRFVGLSALLWSPLVVWSNTVNGLACSIYMSSLSRWTLHLLLLLGEELVCRL